MWVTKSQACRETHYTWFIFKCNLAREGGKCWNVVDWYQTQHSTKKQGDNLTANKTLNVPLMLLNITLYSLLQKKSLAILTWWYSVITTAFNFSKENKNCAFAMYAVTVFIFCTLPPQMYFTTYKEFCEICFVMFLFVCVSGGTCRMEQ